METTPVDVDAVAAETPTGGEVGWMNPEVVPLFEEIQKLREENARLARRLEASELGIRLQRIASRILEDHQGG